MMLFETLSGSRLYGTNRPDSDEDLRGVCLEPVDTLIGLQPQFEQTELPPDTTIWGMKKFFRLAGANNPNILDVLFAPEPFWIVSTEAWRELYALRHNLLSQRVRSTYIGYSVAQLKLIQRHETYKPKHAAHLVRLLFQVEDILRHGDFTPVLSGDALFDVKAALTQQWPLESIVKWAEGAKEHINNLHSSLPAEPNMARIEAVMMEIYRHWINGHGMKNKHASIHHQTYHRLSNNADPSPRADGN
jgi:predicted nucleotidyltransferase